MAEVILENLVKDFPDGKRGVVRAVNEINLTVNDREFMVLVGPSGCGKSTSLRMIAGLEEVSSGSISIDGRQVNNVLPKDRDIAMVFQNYALYPHMSVFDNMAFGLKLMKYPKAEIRERVLGAARILGIEELLERKPKSLSGGQRQRVAVGRAIVRKPKVFLFDEPLSNLDAKMRVSMRTEIAKLHTRLSSTMIYVTHDQVEAMTMGDRITVMKDGNIMQVAEPLRLYNHPENMFVAGFIGSPPMNFFTGKLQRNGDHVEFAERNESRSPFRIVLDNRLSAICQSYVGREIVFGIRPEEIEDVTSRSEYDPELTVEANVEVSEPMGSETYLYLETGSHSFVARVGSSAIHRVNQTVKMEFNLKNAHLFDPETENVIR